jgi:hypothetical protein
MPRYYRENEQEVQIEQQTGTERRFDEYYKPGGINETQLHILKEGPHATRTVAKLFYFAILLHRLD